MGIGERMSCPEQLRTQSLLDGQLDQEDARAAERHLESCDDCLQWRTETDALGHYIRHDATRHSAPHLLAARIGAALDAEERRLVHDSRIRKRSFWFGAAGGAGFSALAAGLVLALLLPPSAGSLTQAVTDAHIGALTRGHVIEVASSNHHTVKPWFAGRVPLSPPVADFTRDGFVLTGGRTDTIAGSQAAVVVYRHGAHGIDLFVWADRGSPLPPAGISHGYHTEFWKSGDLDFAAVSDMETTELGKFVRLVKGERE
jgi:anti-sigma factor RsiW